MVTQEEGLRKGQQVGLWEIALIMLDALLTPNMDGTMPQAWGPGL